jgi:hypothetical protein
MANFDCPWHWKRPEIFAFPFPVVLSVGFASAFLSSVFISFSPVFVVDESNFFFRYDFVSIGCRVATFAAWN